MPPRLPSRRGAGAFLRAAALLLLLIPGAPHASAQTLPGRTTNTASPAERDTVHSDLRVPPSAALDAPVSRTEYRLGPGDVVSVAVFGETNSMYTLPVTPEGTVVVPGVGVAGVLGLNLDQAQARVRQLVLRFYRNVEVSLTLSQVRTFKVYVIGSVPEPGVRLATAVTRISEVVPPQGRDGVARRNVLLRRASGDSVRVDLLRFLQTGDLGSNPVLREGDQLLVPAVDRRVEVFGRVVHPGSYEYRAGETLAELLHLANAGGDFPANAADTVRLTRFVTPERRELLAFTRAEAVGPRGQALALRPFDAVYVAEVAHYMEQRTAVAEGEVNRPGTYPVTPVTTVRDLVEMAGGFTPEASIANATLRRRAPPRARSEAEAVPPEFQAPSERQIAQIRAQGDETNVVIDFQELVAEGGDAYDQPVLDGDVLTVPRRRDEVAILGAVTQPGVVPFAPGRSVEYFVARAGGYSRLADRRGVVVLKAKLGTRVAARDVLALEAGDQIVVPFRERRSFMETVQTASGIATTLTGVILAAITIYNIITPDERAAP